MLAVVVGFIAGMRVQEVPLVISPDENAFDRQSDQWQKAKTLIKRYHPRGEESDSLENQLLNNFLKQLDPYSQFVPFDAPNYYAGNLDGTASHWGVKGIALADTLLVFEVEPGSPLFVKGVEPGDELIMHGDELTWISHNRTEKTIELPEGEVFDLQSCIPAKSSDGKQLYVKIRRFGPNVYREFMQIIENHPEARKQLFIDLRGNPGGDVNQALKLANQFIDREEKELLHMQLPNNKEKTFTSSGKNFFKPGKIRIFIDERTASSAEILAGILQINAGATVIGRESRGKNALMKQFELDQGILHLQTGYYAIEGLEEFGSGGGILPDREMKMDSIDQRAFATSKKLKLLRKYKLFQEKDHEKDTETKHKEWLAQCNPVERLVWLEMMAPHIETTVYFDLLQTRDPYFSFLVN